MNILALDPATKCGYAHNQRRRIQSGTWDFRNGHFDGAGMCFLKLRRRLYDFRDFDLIVYEGVMGHTDAVYAQHKYGGFHATITSFAEEHSIPYHGFPVGEIKKFWTGRGDAGKEQMIHKARLEGFNPADDNEADAIAIWHLGHHCFGML